MTKQRIIPPESGWEAQSWYLVEVSWFPENPVHPKLFFTGFLTSQGQPAGYNFIADDERIYQIHEVYYLKAIREVVSQSEWTHLLTWQLPQEECNEKRKSK